MAKKYGVTTKVIPPPNRRSGSRNLEQVLLMGLVSFGMIQPLRLVCQQVSFTAENEDPL